MSKRVRSGSVGDAPTPELSALEGSVEGPSGGTGAAVAAVYGGDGAGGAVVDSSGAVSDAVQYSVEPFGESETRTLIRIRRDLDSLFQSSKKKAAKEAYVQVADRLAVAGNGEVRPRPLRCSNCNRPSPCAVTAAGCPLCSRRVA